MILSFYAYKRCQAKSERKWYSSIATRWWWCRKATESTATSVIQQTWNEFHLNAVFSRRGGGRGFLLLSLSRITISVHFVTVNSVNGTYAHTCFCHQVSLHPYTRSTHTPHTLVNERVHFYNWGTAFRIPLFFWLRYELSTKLLVSVLPLSSRKMCLHSFKFPSSHLLV